MEEQGVGVEITTELRLGLPGAVKPSSNKRVFSEISAAEGNGSTGETKAPAKNQVVGWPPVCSYRQRNSFSKEKVDRSEAGAGTKGYVKVSMDGALYLRKIDLSMQKGYSDLAFSLEKLFGCHGIGEALNEGEGAEYKLIYEDKDGDWMLVGDVPWEMFMESCRRLRIMKKSEAKDFAMLQTRDFLKGTLKDDN
ncbi:auxin-induced protein 22C-like [Rhodamnia argentea]|uniref:Auxin-responsive protein n=1 Tax=Rhodamnia argentea TaxID=178133 RepID=A0A8B8NUB0_9MYRT|nr:auxin-induced protein 22C-like [Rhodamnia argentea]